LRDLPCFHNVRAKHYQSLEFLRPKAPIAQRRINKKGEVVGYSFREKIIKHSCIPLRINRCECGSLGGKINAACAINDAGQVTGYSQDGNGISWHSYFHNQPIASSVCSTAPH